MKALNFLRPISLKNKIRIGGHQDGGYVVYEKALAHTAQLLTYGVGWETTFEEHFRELTGKPVIMFDPTLYDKSIFEASHLNKLLGALKISTSYSYLRKVKKLYFRHKDFEKKGLQFINEGLDTTQHDKYDTLSNHMKRFGLESKEILLKVDIESGEFGVFRQPQILDQLRNVNQLVIEWHDLKNRLHELKHALSLLDPAFALVHIHGNNYGGTFKFYEAFSDSTKYMDLPDLIETTLVRRSRIDQDDLMQEETSYPVKGLDFPNNPLSEDIPIQFGVCHAFA